MTGRGGSGNANNNRKIFDVSEDWSRRTGPTVTDNVVDMDGSAATDVAPLVCTETRSVIPAFPVGNCSEPHYTSSIIHRGTNGLAFSTLFLDNRFA